MGPDSNASLIGLLLDKRYQLKDLLGAGGMGSVYLAQDIQLGRDVAVKVIEASESNASLVQRLYREARAAASVDHHGVVVTLGYGSDSEAGLDYLVMEHLRGESLDRRICRLQRLPIDFVLRIALDISDVLAAVHAARVIHRDLKPSNVFLSTRGRRVDEIKLLDFGVAKQQGMQTLTSTGQIFGTLHYMAPEQLADSKRADARSDVYALGALLFECVSGRPPFDATDLPSLVRAIALEPIPDLRKLRPECPARLAAIISRCTARDPDQRFTSASELYEALTALNS